MILLDSGLRLQAQAASAGVVRDWDPGDTSLEKLLRLLTAERRPLRVPPVPGSALACGCLATPVSVGDTTLGYLLVLDEKAASADDVDLIVASYAATLFALTLARTQTSLELGLRYRGAIVDSLVSGTSWTARTHVARPHSRRHRHAALPGRGRAPQRPGYVSPGSAGGA